MKKVFTLFICVVFTVFFISAPKVFASQEKNLCIAFGDSIASGYGIDNVNQTYPAIIAKKFSLYSENNAVSGDKSADMLSVIANTPSIKEAALITISIGGNDLIASKDIVLAKAVSERLKAMGLPLSSIQKLIREINIPGVFSGSNIDFSTLDADVEKIFSSLHDNLSNAIKLLRSVNEQTIIIVQTLYNPYLENPEYEIFGFDVGTLIDAYIQKINETYYSVQKELGGTFLIADVASGMNGNSKYFYTSWDFHPTAEGHAYMADVIGELYSKSIQTIATMQSSAATSALTTESTTDFTTTVSTVQTTVTSNMTSSAETTAASTEATEPTSDHIQTTAEPKTSESSYTGTNVPTAEPQIPTEPISQNTDNIKKPIFVCIALVALISICAGIVIKKKK